MIKARQKFPALQQLGLPIPLNRTTFESGAVAQRDSPERGLDEIAAIQNRDRPAAYPFYAAALGEMQVRRRNYAVAREHFCTALSLARNPMERRFLENGSARPIKTYPTCCRKTMSAKLSFTRR
jgi:predicted RNA polymerase sigma factor